MEFPVELLKNNINKLENKKYIYLSHNEEFRKISFIDMLYKCADGSYFLISKPYETISESSQIAISFSVFLKLHITEYQVRLSAARLVV